MDISKFIEAFSGASSEDELTRQIGHFTSTIGISQFALSVIAPQSFLRPTVAIFSNCPSGWVEQYHRDNLLARDPVVYLSMRQTLPIFWDRAITSSIYLPEGGMEVMDMATEFGLRNGVSFPLKGPAGEIGTMSFITSDLGGGLINEAAAILRMAADYIFESAIRVVRQRTPAISLSPRERDCLFWVGEGKRQEEIAAIMGITARTVAYHIQQAVLKTGSSSREQALLKSAIQGLLIPDLTQHSIESFYTMGDLGL
jgi:DNA-binding CsgD family transcriptional regulator